MVWQNSIVIQILTEDGMAVSKELYLGKYNIKEIEVPYGMILNEEVHTVELVYAGQEIEITETAASFTNERQKASISLSKVMEQNEQYGVGMNGELSAVTFGLYATNELIAHDGSVIPTDGLMEIVSVNEDGTATLKTDLPFGSYYLKEMSTDCHYILNDAKYEFAFEYAGQDTAFVAIKANDADIENKLIYGEVHGMKKGEEGEGLAGAAIGIFHTEGTEPIATTISAEDGSFSFTKVPYGEYVVREVEAPEGY